MFCQDFAIGRLKHARLKGMQVMVRKVLVLTTVFVFGLTNAEAQDGFWSALRGPFRGVVSCMSMTQAGSLLVGINGAGSNAVFRSTDQGKNWMYVARASARCFDIDSARELTYVGGDPDQSLLCSSDDGVSWVPASTALYRGAFGPRGNRSVQAVSDSSY